MVTHSITIPEVENTQVRGRDDSRQRGGTSARDTSTPKAEGADTSPRKPSRALTDALRKRRMMVMAGAGDDALAVIDARIARLGGGVAVESPAETFARLTTERVEMVEMKRRRVEALRAELAAAEADLEETVQRYITTPLVEDADSPAVAEQPADSSSPVEDDAPAEQPADRRAAVVLVEPAHVVPVAEVCRNPFCALGSGTCRCGGVPADKPNPFAALAERLVTA